jgi:hypothetical protein
MQKMAFDARFVVEDDLLHSVIELLGLTILASIVVHIRPVSSLNDSGSMNMFLLSLSVSCSWLFHMGRYLELYLAGKGQTDVIQMNAKKVLRMGSVGLGFCAAATIISGMDYFGNDDDEDDHRRGLAAVAEPASSSSSSDLPIWLLLAAPVIDYCIQFVTVVFLFPNDGSHKKFSTYKQPNLR